MLRKLFQFLRDLITVDPALKLLALTVAVLVQLAVERESVRDVSVALPVRVRGVNEGWQYVGSLPDQVRVRLRGRRVALADLAAANNVTLEVDLASYRDGERYTFASTAVEQQLPVRGLEVVSVQPDSLDVRLEVVERRTVPVEAALTGEVSPGFRVSGRHVQLEPAKVVISGPVSRVRQVGAIRTQPIDLALTDRDLQLKVKLVSPDPLIHVVPADVQATVALEELELTRTLVGQPIIIRGCPPTARCSVDPPEVNVRVEGLGRAVGAYVRQPPDNLVVADLGPLLRHSDRTVRLQVNAVRGLALVPTPAVAKFTVVYEASDIPVGSSPSESNPPPQESQSPKPPDRTK